MSVLASYAVLAVCCYLVHRWNSRREARKWANHRAEQRRLDREHHERMLEIIRGH